MTSTPAGSLQRPGALGAPPVRPFAALARPWWRDAVIYQVYVRSFRDSDGDGIGDLAGVRAQLPYLKRLGVDGLWLNPFYVSPQHDHGYDIADHTAVDPVYGTLDEFTRLADACRLLDLRLVLDVVPNHVSSGHPWFRAALSAAPGSPERDLFHFADGTGPHGDRPPNNWRAMFGGPAWSRITEPDGTLGQWYLHLFTPEQPDLNWRDPRVGAEFERILRFWLDRGADGFRIDVATGLFKHQLLPDSLDPEADERTRDSVNPLAWNQPEVHAIWRHWRTICDEYTARDGRGRLLVGEVSVPTAAEQALYLRADELHQSFSFHLLHSGWNPEHMRTVITDALRDIAATGSTTTWTLNNHDQVRTPTRYAGPDPLSGPARATAAALMMLALPGAAYLYQGEELGLPEVLDLPDEMITDPIFRRTDSRVGIRDGCRVPLPWTGAEPPFGFSPPPRNGITTTEPWLPQPDYFAAHTAERALADGNSVWHLYREALQLRHTLPQLGESSLSWIDAGPGVLAFTRGEGFVCAVNFNDVPVSAPVRGTPLLASGHCADGILPADTAAWWFVEPGDH
ncbi:glycoside hydrolase family 13 protein [Streptomyces sp. NPDC058469]|uniref:glycoside hydrolase family 13 protein n=1 Tax=Streptomyces sp. NPDC058469 TaxID=3346514 RepID=UPI003658EC2D